MTLAIFPVSAQEVSSENETVLEEIIVTATLREVSLQDLPMSVAALTGQDLRDIGAISIDDVWRQVPNLAVRDAPFGGNVFLIRGLTDTDTFLSTESINAFYLDDTPLTFVSGLFSTPGDAALLDLQRMEVLRGPQGTLVGANAMGGVVRYVSNEPDPGDSLGHVEANLSSTSEGGWNYGGNAVWNQPTGPDSAVRFAALYQDDEGFIDDIGLDRSNVNARERAAGRFSWLWNINAQWDALTRVYAENVDTGGYNYADDVGRHWTGQFTDGDYQVINSVPEFREEELRLASLRLRRHGNDSEFYSSTSFYEKDVFLVNDWYQEHWFFFGLDHPAEGGNSVTQKDFTQEFRLNSTGDGRFGWLLGAFYLDQEEELDEWLFSEDIPVEHFGVRAGGTVVYVDSHRSTQREDMALFGEVSWRFTDALEGVFGLRWYDSERSQQIGAGGIFVIPGTAEGDSDGWISKASLSWDINEQTMVYGQVSQGFRPGQFNNPGAISFCGARPVIDDDELTNYEVGLKHRSEDGTAIINASVFYVDWEDMQFNAFSETCPFPVLENVGAASSQGFELDFSWLLADHFKLQGGIGYTDAQLDSEFVGEGVNIPAGTTIPNVPEWTANVAGTWEFNWRSEWPGYVRVDAQYVDERTTLFDETIDWPMYRRLDDYFLADLRVGMQTGEFLAELFITNVFDERAETFCCRMFFDPTINRPRTIGLRTMWDFD
jgi:outer membrane receptor protein involved in Fe transport